MENFKAYLTQKAGLTDEEFIKINGNDLKTKKYAKGTYLLSQGEICHYTFFVEQGLLRAFTIDEVGKEHIIQFAPENWLISDRSSAYFNEPSVFFIEAIEETTVVSINKDFFMNARAISAPFRKYNDFILQNHIRHLQNRINLLLAANAEKKYMDFIHLYPDLTLRVPQWMIASYLGITPESLSRVRKNLAKKNFKS